ncbi:MAG: hypothetical protein LLG06_06680 [Desulfobacteraceae bacterium]|nr:hypothetical protein [Desulfobacteraceae bacterium]
MRRARTAETCIGLLILIALAGIAATIYSVQSRFDPSYFTAMKAKEEKAPARISLPAPSETAAPSFLPESLVPMGPSQTFNAETLSDKIDGKAELYLSSGFASLTSSRFAKRSDAKSWLELYVYDMGEAGNAFSVYTVQKRKEGQDFDLGAAAYKTEDAVFFINGSKYVEIVSSSPNMGDEMLALAENLVGSDPQQNTRKPDTAGFFPPESLDAGSVTLHMSDVFGFSELNRVYTANYEMGALQVTAFVSKRENAGEAAGLAEAYGRFLIENGGSEIGPVPGIPNSKLYQVYDTFETVLHKGPFFAGTHEAETRESAVEIASRLYRKLVE